MLGRLERHLAAWVAIAGVNAAFVAMLRPPAALGTRALHHFYDAGQLCAAGLVVAVAVQVWPQRSRLARGLGYAASLACALALAAVYARPDLEAFAERVAAAGRTRWVLWGSVVAVACTVPGAALVGWVLARPWWRWLGVVLALGIAVANGLFLRNDYRGIHLFAVIAAAVSLGAVLDGVAVPAWLSRPRGRLSRRTSVAVVTCAAVVSVVIPPSTAVRALLFRTEGAVMLPIVTRLMDRDAGRAVHVPRGAEAWYHDRRHAREVPPSAPRLLPPDGIVVLISIDSMRASLFEDSKSRRQLRPLDHLRQHSVEFTTARSPAARTAFTWGAVFTGRHMSAVRWRGVNPSRDRSVRFPALLSRAGIRTVNVIAAGRDDTAPQLEETGVRGGFREQLLVRPRRGQHYATSTEVIPEAIAQLEAQGPGPCFLFAHLMDPHFPYDSVKRRGSSFDRYLAEVAQAGRGVADVLEALRAFGFAHRTALFVTADHGEAFGQHDTPYHTITLYEELLRVPLFVHFPRTEPRRIAQPVSLIDLGPTILDLFGLPTPGAMLGQSLAPLLRGEDVRLTRPIAAERPFTRALVLGGHKVIVDA